jgi:CheY-like chemotaxis protein
MSPSSFIILLVEDNDDDVFAMKRALKAAKILNPLQLATDGQKAIDYLSGAGEYANRERFPLPFIVFLDLKLPYVHGFEVLSWLQNNPQLEIAVIVLTSSAETRDHEKSYKLGARSYLIKPPTPEGLRDVFDSLQSYWQTKLGSHPVQIGD